MSKIDTVYKIAQGCLLGSPVTRMSPEMVMQVNCKDQWCTSCPGSASYFIKLIHTLENANVTTKDTDRSQQ